MFNSKRHWFYFNLILLLLLHFIPFLSVPIKWFETYFHELSHGLAAILTGGEIVNLKIRLNGSGECITRGGMAFIISFAGYSGAACFGLLFSKIYLSCKKNLVTLASLLVFISLILVTILYVRDLITFAICTFILILIYCSMRYLKLKQKNMLGLFIAMSIIFNAIKSPLYLFDGQHRGDGARLADMTFIPEFIWIAIWFSWGALMLFYLWRSLYAKHL
ncbi:M50 family metallopeptidase [Catenovulum sediminis]|uniref:M50 family metallopeptidase n=1 Tax=Catenovulum sediminis TaxID=1740262 RepID=UPI00117C3C41|nr:M50 family metallopeptidase [Catenovulum sediminis]